MLNLTRKTVYMFVGLPCAGKSTLREKLVSIFGDEAVIVSSDDYLEAKAAEAGLTYNDVFQDHIKAADLDMYSRLGNAQGHPGVQLFVWDQTNLTPKARKKKLDRFPGDYNKVAVVFECDEKVRQERLMSRPGKVIPSHVDKSMRETYVAPTLGEGFGSIVTSTAFEETLDGIITEMNKVEE